MVSFASGDRGIIARSSVGGKLGGGSWGTRRVIYTLDTAWKWPEGCTR